MTDPDDELGEPKELPPSIVRDVQADAKAIADKHREWPAESCCECGKSLEHENTIHIHAGNAYCSRCYHAENQ
jgi:hypothetical protein